MTTTWTGWLLFGTLILTAWAASGCWLLQVVAYPTYRIVGREQFVPFHVDFGRRLIPVFVVPAVLACLSFFALIFARPPGAPLLDAIVAAVAGAIVLATTGAIEVPTHMALDRDGYDDAKIDSLIRWNLVRALAWLVALGALSHATLAASAP